MNPALKFLKYLLCIAFLFTVVPAFAQVDFTADDVPSEPGTLFTYYVQSDMEGIEVEIGDAGENRAWDFSEFVAENMQVDTLINPEDAPDAETYPNANRVLRTAQPMIDLGMGDVFQYEIVADSGWYLIGVVTINEGGGQGIDLPLDFSENPIIMLPLPTEYEQQWDIAAGFSFGFPAPDTLMNGALDSIYISIAIGGFSEVDAWGTVTYTGGEVEALRQHIMFGVDVGLIGVMTVFGQRVEIELPIDFGLEASHAYRWIAPGVGEIAYVQSLPLEEDPNFALASVVRVRALPPALGIQEARLDFGEVHIGNAGTAQLSFTNEGEGIAIISEIDTPAQIMDELEFLGELPVRIDPGSEATMRFLWSPQAEQDLNDLSILLYHNDPTMENPLNIDLAGGTPSGVSTDDLFPAGFSLGQNYPNPFNGLTVIPFSLRAASSVQFSILDMEGRTLLSEYSASYPAGSHQIRIDMTSFSEGIYIYKLTAGSNTVSNKMIYMK